MADERERDVRVADQADAIALLVQAQLGQQRGQHVLPDGVARAGVVEAHRSLLCLRLERGEEGEVLRRDHLLRPLRGQARAQGELVQRDLAGDREVVISGQAHGGVLAGELHAGVGLGSVADEVAEAPQLGGVAGRDRFERRLEGVSVGVDVGDDRDLHCCR